MAAATATAIAPASRAVAIRRIRLRRCSRRHRSSNPTPSRPAMRRISPLCSPSAPPSFRGLRSAASGASVRPFSVVVRRARGKQAGGTPEPITAWIAPPGLRWRNSSISRGTQEPGATAFGVQRTISCCDCDSSSAIAVSMCSEDRASSRSRKTHPRRRCTIP
jgi:hypothetical protein